MSEMRLNPNDATKIRVRRSRRFAWAVERMLREFVGVTRGSCDTGGKNVDAEEEDGEARREGDRPGKPPSNACLGEDCRDRLSFARVRLALVDSPLRSLLEPRGDSDRFLGEPTGEDAVHRLPLDRIAGPGLLIQPIDRGSRPAKCAAIVVPHE